MKATKELLRMMTVSKKGLIESLKKEIIEYPETKYHNTKQIARLDIEIAFIKRELL